MLTYKKVMIRRSELQTAPDIVPAWELPILEALHDDVTETGEILLDRDPPGAEDEYKRLENRYPRVINEDGSKGLPLVAAVYGQFNIGVATLKRLIDAATVNVGDNADLLGESPVGRDMVSVGG